MRPMMILIQSVELMRSDAFKKPWSGVVETEGLIRKGSLHEVKFLHQGYDVHCEQEVSTSQKEANMFSRGSLSVGRMKIKASQANRDSHCPDYSRP